MARLLVIAAHPDAETAGAASLLTTLPDCAVLHLSDGVPRDRALWPSAAPLTRDDYASQRRGEALSAMEIAGIAPSEVHCLGLQDQELAFHLTDLARELVRWMIALEPELVVTHSYEGGHPDADAAAFATSAARDLLLRSGQRAPMLLEMALCNGAGGELTVGQFVASDDVGPPQIQCAFRGTALDRKREMLRCFESQEEALAPFFTVEYERFRPAPRYEFAAPPHFGPLLYEQRGMEMDGDTWRALAARARGELSLGARLAAA
jgi:LmbE family N-acetylglucosaminyl deacetylase